MDSGTLPVIYSIEPQVTGPGPNGFPARFFNASSGESPKAEMFGISTKWAGYVPSSSKNTLTVHLFFQLCMPALRVKLALF